MKVVYCANCGTRLNVQRKALPKYGKIINLVEHHGCPEEPVPFDLTPVDVPQFRQEEGKDKFVQKLNDLQPPPGVNPNLVPPGDHRSEEHVKSETDSTAPQSLLQNIQSLTNSTPERPLEDPED